MYCINCAFRGLNFKIIRLVDKVENGVRTFEFSRQKRNNVEDKGQLLLEHNVQVPLVKKFIKTVGGVLSTSKDIHNRRTKLQCNSGFTGINDSDLFLKALQLDRNVDTVNNRMPLYLALVVDGMNCSVPIAFGLVASEIKEFGTVVNGSIQRLTRNTDCKLEVRMHDIEKQSNGFDCGLHAIANCFLLCSRKDPCRYSFDKVCLRNHLISCFNQQKRS
uniref:Ubiquitin-like protease family profile domain-containing protein n=1 Tax=Strigamia maritima TaxID=126957 RepID=T1ITE3_STRMM